MPPSIKNDALVAFSLIGIGAAIPTIARKYFLKKDAPPKVWKHVVQGGKWGKLNRPVAGAIAEKPLPIGKHAIQLHSLATPNGVKVTSLLEGLNLRYGLEYDAFLIDISKGDQFNSGFVAGNPNSKIPLLLHYKNGLDKPPVKVFETSAIMMYLCETFDKDNTFLPAVDDPLRAECLSWLFFVHGSAPYLGGGFGHFYHYAPTRIKYAIDRFAMETKRQLSVLDRQLGGIDGRFTGGGPYLCGDQLTIADLACWPWYGVLMQGKLYDAGEFLQVEKEYPNLMKWTKLMSSKEAVKRGRMVNRTWGGDEEQLTERHSSQDFIDKARESARNW